MENGAHKNPWLFAAGLLGVLAAGVHVFAGGPEILTPTRSSSLDPVVISVWSVVWHAVTWVLILIAAAQFWASRRPAVELVVFTVAVQLGLAILFMYYGLSDLGSLVPMPQWVIFLAVPTVSIIGLRKGAR